MNATLRDAFEAEMAHVRIGWRTRSIKEVLGHTAFKWAFVLELAG